MAQNAAVLLKNLDNAKVSVMVQLPLTLKVALDKEAAEMEIGTASLVRQIVGEHYGVEVEAVTRGRKPSGMSPEQKKAAQRAKEKAKRDLIKQVQAKYMEGGEDAAKAFIAEMLAQAGVEDTEDSDDSE